MAEKLMQEIWSAHPNQKVMMLGGDHSVFLSTNEGYLETKKDRQVGFIHFDAHTDLLRSRMGVDICFGSWTSHIVQMMKHPYLFVQFGIRATGQDRGHWERDFGIKQYWSDEINDKGIQTYIDRTIEQFKEEKVSEIYITVDIDALDAKYAGATGTPEEEGLSADQICRTIEALWEASLSCEDLT